MEWEYLFSSRVLERGYQYYATGAVYELEKTSTGYTAYVEGTYDYLVEIDFSNGEIESMSCSCPYADDGNHCKHMVAVLYELEEGGYDLSVDAEPKETLEQAVNGLSEAEAKRLLQLFGEGDPDIRMRILQFSTAKVSVQQEEQWDRYLWQITHRAAGRSGYIDYDRAFEFFSELRGFLSDNIPLLLERGLAMEAFRLICRVCELADGQDFDDFDGGFSMLLEECDAWWCDAVDVASEDQREEMYRWFASSAEKMYLDFTKARLLEVQVDAFRDEKFLRENLELVDRLLNDGDLDYPMGELVLMRLRLMRELSVPEEEIAACRREYRRLPEVWNLELLKYLEEGRAKEAIAMLKEKAERCEKEGCGSNPFELQQTRHSLIEVYEQFGMKAEYREELERYVFRFHQRDLRYVQLLKKCVPLKEWPALRDKLLETESISSVRCDFLKQEKMVDELFVEVMKAPAAFRLRRYEDVLKERYPEELLAAFVNFAREDMERANSRNTYRGIIGDLKYLRSYPGGQQEINQLVAEWKTKYRRRSSMLDELRKAGY